MSKDDDDSITYGEPLPEGIVGKLAPQQEDEVHDFFDQYKKAFVKDWPSTPSMTFGHTETLGEEFREAARILDPDGLRKEPLATRLAILSMRMEWSLEDLEAALPTQIVTLAMECGMFRNMSESFGIGEMDMEKGPIGVVVVAPLTYEGVETDYLVRFAVRDGEWKIDPVGILACLEAFMKQYCEDRFRGDEDALISAYFAVSPEDMERAWKPMGTGTA